MFRFRLPKREEVLNTWPLNYLAGYLTAPGLWAFRRRSVTWGVSWGLFCCYLPIPFQMVVAAVGCLLMHINLPVALASVWVTNPVTIPFMLYFAFVVGDVLMPSQASMSLADFKSVGDFADLFADLLPQLLLGCLVLGIFFAAIGYVASQIAWYLWMRRRWVNILKIRELRNFLLHKDGEDDDKPDIHDTNKPPGLADDERDGRPNRQN